jgi:uncharacterized lipoprotein YddW (UPF0748 family)
VTGVRAILRKLFLGALVTAPLLWPRAAAANEDRILWYSVGDNLQSTGNIQNAINFAVTNKFNAICYLARYRADAYYFPNRDFNTYSNPEPRKSSTTDYLQYVIDHGHEAGLRVYISFSCFLVTDGTNSYPGYLPGGSVSYVYSSSSSQTTYAPASGYPKAMTTVDDAEGLWADVGRADVRNYTTNVALDIVKNYDIDGILFDRVRYRGDDIPHNTAAFGYNPTALSEMVSLGELSNTTPAPGAAAFITARQNAVARFITNTTSQIYSLKPWVITGATPITYSGTLNDTYNSVFQYFPAWNAASNPGHVSGFGNLDFVAPQYYRTDPTLNAQTMDLTNAAIDEVNRIKHQSTFSASSSVSNELAQNICDGRQKGLVGFGIFAYSGTSAAGYIAGANGTATSPCGTNIIGTATAGADYTNKTGWDTTPPNPVTGASASGGFRTCTLNWTPPAAASDGDTAVRYLVYRSASSPVKEYYSNQLAVTSTITGNSYTDAGAPQGSLYYKIVAVDDFNNKTAVQVGPVTVTGLDVYVESRTNSGGLTPTPSYAENAAFSDTTSKSTVNSPGTLSGSGARYTATVGRTATFTPFISQPGNYNIYVTLGSGSNNNAHANYVATNSAADRLGSVYLTTGAGAPANLVNGWCLLESNVPMPAGQTKGITFTNVDGNAAIGARFVMDAVRYEFVSATSQVIDWSVY